MNLYQVAKTTLEALQRCVAMLETAPNREAAEIWNLKIEGLCKVVRIIPAEFIRAFDALDFSGIDFTREVSADENPERVP